MTNNTQSPSLPIFQSYLQLLTPSHSLGFITGLLLLLELSKHTLPFGLLSSLSPFFLKHSSETYKAQNLKR